MDLSSKIRISKALCCIATSESSKEQMISLSPPRFSVHRAAVGSILADIKARGRFLVFRLCALPFPDTHSGFSENEHKQ